MSKIAWLLFIAMFAVGSAFAQGRVLSLGEVERVKVLKTLTAEVDRQTLAKTVADIERTANPIMVLIIKETVAAVYSQIVAEQLIKDLPTKQWLYNTVALNMANIQFGGGPGRDPVNVMITQRLRKTLPVAVWDDPDFSVSVD